MLATVKKVGPALDLFSADRPEWGVSEVAGALGMSKSSAHALLTTMDEVGLLNRTADARYRLGWRLLSLSRTLMQTTEVRQRISRALRRAVDRTGETMHLAVYDRGSVMYLERVRSPHSLRLPTDTGTRLPPHPSAVGKVLLAHRGDDATQEYLSAGRLRRYTVNTIASADELLDELERVRADGVAYDREETIQGVCCVSAPIRAATGEVVAAISVSAKTASFDRDGRFYRQLVCQVVDEASPSLQLAFSPPE
jgi:IclR family transcriptional regulator, KDG regulon repressor